LTRTDSGKLELTEFEPAHWDSLLALYRRYFGDVRAERFARRWHWQYRDNQFCDEFAPFIQVLLCGGEVIAHLGAFPLPLRLSGVRQMALCGADLVAEPEGRMAAMRMIGRLAQRSPAFAVAIHDGAAGVFRHCGARTLAISRQDFHLRLRSRGTWCRAIRRRLPEFLAWLCTPGFIGALQALPRMLIAPLALRGQLDRVPHGIELRLIERFGAAYEALWQEACGRYANSLDKTARYMNWRYLDQPQGPALCLAAHHPDGGLAGVLVAGTVSCFDEHGRPCGVDGEILELIVEEPGFAAPLIVRAVAELDRKKVDRIRVTGLSQDLRLPLVEMGFLAAEDDRLAASMVGAGDEGLAGSLESWYWTGGDGDGLYAG